MSNLLSRRTATGRPARHPLTGAQREALFAYLFLGPSLLFFLIFFVTPMVIEFLASLHGGQALLGRGPYVGIQNYIDAMKDSMFWDVLRITVVFSLMTVSGGVVLGMALALILNEPLPLRTLFRSLIYFPYLTAFVITALIFRVMLDPYQGILNGALRHLGLPLQNWLINPSLALPLLAAVTVWHGVGNNVVIFLAGLAGIPQELYEASDIDGATLPARLLHITLPLLAPVILFVVIIGLVESLEAFLQPFVMTQGGPANETRLYAYHVYNVAFSDLKFGYASALAFILFALMLLITVVILRFSRWQAEY